jgi:peptide/nickel transport system permease protein
MNYFLKRIGQTVLTLFAAMTIAFILFRIMPGSPVDAYKAQLLAQAQRTGEKVSYEELNAQVEQYMGVDPDKPIPVAYYEYMRDVILYQDFGSSISTRPGMDVFDVLFAAMPWSVFISIYGLILGFGVSILLGALMAYKEGTRVDYGLTVWGQILASIPYYVAAITFLAVFAFQMGLFPTGGRYNTATSPGFNIPFMLGVINHGALPILTGFILGFGGSLSMRANSIKELGSDYLRSAKLRGVGGTRITSRYVMRNAILPMYTGLLIGIAGIFSSGVITEKIFRYPGVGWYLFGALTARDYPLLMGSFIFYTTLTVLGILMADLTYGLIDPRVKTGGERESF